MVEGERNNDKNSAMYFAMEFPLIEGSGVLGSTDGLTGDCRKGLIELVLNGFRGFISSLIAPSVVKLK